MAREQLPPDPETAAMWQQHVAIVEGAHDAILSETPEGVITSWNPAAERVFGYSAKEALGRQADMLVAKRFATRRRELLQRVVGGEHVAPQLAPCLCKDGREVELSISLSPLRQANGELIGVSSIARQPLGHAPPRSHADDAEEFVYIAAHDLQEPLRIVGNFAQLLGQNYRGQLDERADKYIHYIVDGAQRMQQMVHDLLDYSRVVSRGKPLVPTSSERALDGALQALREPVRRTGAQIEHGPLPEVMADSAQLRQLLESLLDNAIKFRSQAPPRVRVDAARNRDRWVFSVADNGLGIQPKFADRVFQIFQRLHPRGAYEGSGMGLALARRIVERHGGQIGFEPRPGGGTTFRFELQAVSGPSEQSR